MGRQFHHNLETDAWAHHNSETDVLLNRRSWFESIEEIFSHKMELNEPNLVIDLFIKEGDERAQFSKYGAPN